MATRAAAVAMFTLLELRRRRLLALFVVLEGLIVAVLGIAPLVVPGTPTGEERSLMVLSILSGVAGGALLVGAIGLGLMVIRNDLDSGAIAAILAKPVSRLAYAAGKLAAAAALLVAFDGLFAIATIGLLALDGGGHEAVAIRAPSDLLSPHAGSDLYKGWRPATGFLMEAQVGRS
jgi:ABC-type transport system involved in multi-copper enzyme maturation permease subunit